MARASLIELVDAGGNVGLFLAQSADGVMYWTADPDDARQFSDQAAAQAFAEANIGADICVVEHRRSRAA